MSKSSEAFYQNMSGERWWDEVIHSLKVSAFDLHHTYQCDKDGRAAIRANLPIIKEALRQIEAVVRKSSFDAPAVDRVRREARQVERIAQ